MVFTDFFERFCVEAECEMRLIGEGVRQHTLGDAVVPEDIFH